MATREFSLVPQEVPRVETKYRKIQTKIPVPESVKLLEELRVLEPKSMGGQPPVVWDRGEDFTVCDAFGNRWLDFSSGVLVASAGHGRKEIVDAICEMARSGLYHAYCFPTEVRLELVRELTALLPAPLARIFLLTTGSEATECCIKLAKTKGIQLGGEHKNIFVTYCHFRSVPLLVFNK